MTKKELMKLTNDPILLGSLPALRRAAKAALRLGQQTSTPVYVLRRGRVVNINPTARKTAARKTANLCR